MIRTENWLTICLAMTALLLQACALTADKPAGKARPGEEQAGAPCYPTYGSTTTPTNRFLAFDRERHADDELLVYASRFSRLPADAQKKELAAVNQGLAKNRKDPFLRLKAGLIFSLPGSDYRDYAKGQAMLQELLREPGLEEDLVAMVDLTKSYVAELQKLESANAKMDQKLKEDQKRADELQIKLNELKNIEKALIERGLGKQP